MGANDRNVARNATQAVIPECRCRESMNWAGRGFPTTAFGNDGIFCVKEHISSFVWTIIVQTCIIVRMNVIAAKNARNLRFDSVHQEAFLNLWRTYDRLRAMEDEVFGANDLTPQQYNALRLLRSAHPNRIPTLSLAGQLVSRAPDITRLLDKLAERRFIDRVRPEKDRRTVQVGITNNGLDLLNSLSSEVRQCHERQLGHMNPDELAQLVKLLRRARQPHESDGSDWR